MSPTPLSPVPTVSCCPASPDNIKSPNTATIYGTGVKQVKKLEPRDEYPMAGAYEIRGGGGGGDVKNKKQSMADLKLRRLNELNSRLKEDLERPRIKVSEASMSLIQYTNTTKDFMVPSIWGQVEKREDPYAPQQSGGCCSVM